MLVGKRQDEAHTMGKTIRELVLIQSENEENNYHLMAA